jgi:hypothetical protein
LFQTNGSWSKTPNLKQDSEGVWIHGTAENPFLAFIVAIIHDFKLDKLLQRDICLVVDEL